MNDYLFFFRFLSPHIQDDLEHEVLIDFLFICFWFLGASVCMSFAFDLHSTHSIAYNKLATFPDVV